MAYFFQEEHASGSACGGYFDGKTFGEMMPTSFDRSGGWKLNQRSARRWKAISTWYLPRGNGAA